MQEDESTGERMGAQVGGQEHRWEDGSTDGRTRAQVIGQEHMG